MNLNPFSQINPFLGYTQIVIYPPFFTTLVRFIKSKLSITCMMNYANTEN